MRALDVRALDARTLGRSLRVLNVKCECYCGCVVFYFPRAQEHSVMLPALLVSRGPGVQRRASSILFSTLQEMISHVRRAALATFVRTSLCESPIIVLNHFDLLNKKLL